MCCSPDLLNHLFGGRHELMRNVAVILTLSLALTSGCFNPALRERECLTRSERVEIMATVYHLTDEKIQSITCKSDDIVRVRTGIGDWPGKGQQFEFERTNGVWHLQRKRTWVE
jgi:hypothetical protein